MSDYNSRLAREDIETDEVKERVPTLGLNPGQYDSVDSVMSTGSIRRDKAGMKGPRCDSGVDVDSGIFSCEFEPSLKSITSRIGNVQLNPELSAHVEETDNINKSENVASVQSMGYHSYELNDEDKKRLEIAQQIYTPDDDGDTKLHLAIIQPAVELIDQFLDFCPDPHWLSMQNLLGQSPLHLAVLTQQPAVVRKLVVWGSLLEMRDRHGNTPLHLACKLGYGTCVEALTVPVQQQDYQQVPEGVRLYQSLPQDLSIKNYDGETCLHLAASIGHTNIVNYLVKNCHADLNVQEGKSGRTVLHQAVEANNISLVGYLLQQPGVDKEALTYDLSTPLKLAYGRRHASIMTLLLQFGADRTQIREDDSGTDSDDEMELDNSSQSYGSMVR